MTGAIYLTADHVIDLHSEHDGPAELKKYGSTYDAKPGWLFLTGERDDIDARRWSVGIRDPDPAVDRDRSQQLPMPLPGQTADWQHWFRLSSRNAELQVGPARRRVVKTAAAKANGAKGGGLHVCSTAQTRVSDCRIVRCVDDHTVLVKDSVNISLMIVGH